MRTMFDAAYPPPPSFVKDFDAVAGYIGGNTPNVWLDQEWEQYPQRWRLPIFVRSHDGNPITDADSAVAWLQDHHVPVGSTLALDYETRIDGAYLTLFDRLVFEEAKYPVMVYGSISTITQNPKPSGGYWIADWTGHPHMVSGSAATQWSGSGPFNGAYDPNLIADTLVLWDMEGIDMITDTEINAIADAVVTKLSGGKFMGHRWDTSAGALTFTELLGKYRKRHLYKQLDDMEAKLDGELSVILTDEQFAELKQFIRDVITPTSGTWTVNPPA